MLQILIEYGVPISLFLLMLIAGTEVSATDIAKVQKSARPLVLGATIPLIVLPIIALLIQTIVRPAPVVAAGLLLLAACPGGGISNYYCYLARCGVLLSATITAIGTLLSLSTIPTFLWIAPIATINATSTHKILVQPIMMQLLLMMVVPLLFGALANYIIPAATAKYRRPIRTISSFFVAIILALAVWSTRSTLEAALSDIIISAALFVLSAMLLGWILGNGLSEDQRSVLVFETGTRNIGVALLLGGAILTPADFAIFASFLTAYFIVEVAVMLLFASAHLRRIGLVRS